MACALWPVAGLTTYGLRAYSMQTCALWACGPVPYGPQPMDYELWSTANNGWPMAYGMPDAIAVWEPTLAYAIARSQLQGRGPPSRRTARSLGCCSTPRAGTRSLRALLPAPPRVPILASLTPSS